MTTLRLGYTNPLTDLFGAHPVLGGPLDLDDGQTFALLSPEGLELPAPTRTVLPAGNIRTRGERASRAIYARNREARCQLMLGPAASGAALVQTLRMLVAWLSLPPDSPLTVQYQPPNGSAPVYLDVVACAHSIPTDEDSWIELMLHPLELVFIARPGLRGDRLWLQNLAMNPGLEAPSGSAVAVFADSFANANAYALQAGSAPGIAANFLSLPSGTRVAFGSPAWGAINQWTLRFQWITSLVGNCYLHFADANNWLRVQVSNGTLNIQHNIAGSIHTVATAAPALTNGNNYWLQLTQFPSVLAAILTPQAGDPPVVTATLFNDSAGTLGSPVASGSVSAPTFDALTALVGRPQLEASGATFAIGGAFAGVHTLSLFGPGGWLFQDFSGVVSGAWDGTRAELGMSGSATPGTQTYGGGPVPSLAAARVDAPPAGAWNAGWSNYSGGTPAGSGALPVPTAGDVVPASAWVKSSGLAGSASIVLQVREWNVAGSFLRSTTLQTLTGNQPTWTQLAGSVTTGASCAYVDALITASDSGSSSANGAVWLDNVQCWDRTLTGQTSMPYCELRFPQSPAQLLVSGLLGDLPAPALLELGTFVSSLAPGGAITYAVGRSGRLSPNAALVAPAHGYYSTGVHPPQATPLLDSTSYGGFYPKVQLSNAGWGPHALSPRLADVAGLFHLLARFRSQDAAPTAVQLRALVVEQLQPFFNDAGLNTLGIFWGPYQNPLAQANVWTLADAGQVQLPPFPPSALTDPTQLFAVPEGQWVGSSGTAYEADANWLALLPIDGSLLYDQLLNASNSGTTVTSSWLYVYADGLLVNRASVQDGPALAYSVEGVPLPNPAHAAASTGTLTTGTLSVNGAADPYPILDPTLTLPSQQPSAGGINQLLALATDASGTVLPLCADVLYSPLYLWPR